MVKLKTARRGMVSASTVLEVLIAMIFLLVIFGIAITIYANVQRQSVSTQQLGAKALLEQKLAEAEKGLSIGNETIDLDSIIIEKAVTVSTINDSLYLVQLKAIDKNGKNIAELKKLIIPHP